MNRQSSLEKGQVRVSLPLTNHERVAKILSSKPFHTRSKLLSYLLIVIGCLMIWMIVVQVSFIWPEADISSIVHNLRLNDPSVILDNHPIRLPDPSLLPNCQIGEQKIGPIKTFKTPSSHPLPAVGSTDLFDQQKCSTYEDRYYPYKDEILGMTYLNEYPPPLPLKSKTWEDRQNQKQALVQAMINSNLYAERGNNYLDWRDVIDRCHGKEKKAKRALVIRTYENYTWARDDILNVRALIVELALKPKPEERYDVRILLDVHQRNSTFVMSQKQSLAILQSSIPKEFWHLTTLWSEDEMAWLYPGLPGKLLLQMKPTNSYRSCLMPIQVFSKNHPEYEFVWNWEMDTRSTQEYSIILEKIERFAAKAPIDRFLDNQSFWKVPALSTQDTLQSNADESEADLITLNPIFNTSGSGYYWAYDYQNFSNDTRRKSSIGKNLRFSKRLLEAMNEANADQKSSAHCENFAPTILVKKAESDFHFDQSWKGVYVPHPIFTRHQWSNQILHDAINREDIYKKVNERALRDFSFYYDGAHAKDIYDSWRKDKRVCRTPSLLHPIRF